MGERGAISLSSCNPCHRLFNSFTDHALDAYLSWDLQACQKRGTGSVIPVRCSLSLGAMFHFLQKCMCHWEQNSSLEWFPKQCFRFISAHCQERLGLNGRTIWLQLQLVGIYPVSLQGALIQTSTCLASHQMNELLLNLSSFVFTLHTRPKNHLHLVQHPVFKSV